MTTEIKTGPQPKAVEVFSLGRSVRTGELTFVEFTQVPQLTFPPECESWTHPFNDRELVVRHIEPVCAIQTPEGRRYVAIEPQLFDLLSYAVDARMAEKLASANADVVRQKERSAHLGHEVDRAWGLVRDKEASAVRANAELFEFHMATFWQRLKYLFTRSLD
jgi:hypothetical protein